ncbi:oxidoreductase, short chain dehydrogenase/reductase family protein [Oesophagostomum dentatum]|uniref:Oxidoreductase, short chain dehydrogenase/reductase family protein n=1 Tax=Oesophagostomum dentatum TaxID=61180 RepID=A0A0B1TGG9_OESDE|nr:oxidoreductase, short chain dehydrogenase/reductase family protein [Oesophagostomum dentatum]
MIFSPICEIFDALVSNFGPRGLKKPKDISGKIVLITGAGNGIGRLISVKLATTGCRLVLWDIDTKGNEETKRLCEELGAETHTYDIDMSDRQAIYDSASAVIREVGDVDIVVNNAGILRDGGDFLDKSDDVIEKTMRVNTLAHIWMAKAFLPSMIERDEGHIVCICSMSGIVGAKACVDYGYVVAAKDFSTTPALLSKITRYQEKSQMNI